MKHIIHAIVSYSITLILISIFSNITTAGAIISAYTVMLLSLAGSYFE